jgi:hypothetical protein
LKVSLSVDCLSTEGQAGQVTYNPVFQEQSSEH